MASGSGSHHENTPQRIWDENFRCERVDDVLYAMPISQYKPPLQEAAPPSPSPSPPQGAVEQQELHEPPPPANQHGGRRRRNLTASLILETKKYSCHLFRCEEMNKNILSMNEVGTENRTFYVLTPYEKDGKKKIQAKETPIGQIREITPVVGQIYPNINNRSNLSIQQRLEGKWTIELRERIESMKFEKFYTHERIDKTFRSMNEVATFIAYNVIY